MGKKARFRKRLQSRKRREEFSRLEMLWQIFQNKSLGQRAASSLKEIHIHLGPYSSQRVTDGRSQISGLRLIVSSPSFWLTSQISAFSSHIAMRLCSQIGPLRYIALPWGPNHKAREAIHHSEGDTGHRAEWM